MNGLFGLCVKIYEMFVYNTMTVEEIAGYLNLSEDMVQDAVSVM